MDHCLDYLFVPCLCILSMFIRSFSLIIILCGHILSWQNILLAPPPNILTHTNTLSDNWRKQEKHFLISASGVTDWGTCRTARETLETQSLRNVYSVYFNVNAALQIIT